MAITTAERSARYNAKPVAKNCPECGTTNIVTRKHKGICDHCKNLRRARFRPQTFANCDYCGERFGPLTHLGVKFCSYKCSRMFLAGGPSRCRGKQRPHTRRAESRLCLSCMVEFRAVKDTKRRKQIYCSHTCYLRNRRVSHFEIAVMDLLESLGITLERQHRVGRWTFDAQLAGTRILVEADGEYWHRDEKVKARDIRKNAWSAEHGFSLVRVNEIEFYRNPMAAISSVVARWETATGKKAERAGELSAAR
jgi:very-short-patch-repair endonuclease